jgi:hypothetical protein
LLSGKEKALTGQEDLECGGQNSGKVILFSSLGENEIHLLTNMLLCQ